MGAGRFCRLGALAPLAIAMGVSCSSGGVPAGGAGGAHAGNAGGGGAAGLAGSPAGANGAAGSSGAGGATSGAFGPAVLYPVPPGTRAVATGDVNGDGWPDLVTANCGGIELSAAESVSVLMNRGDGTFAPAVSLPGGAAPIALAIADLNGDGALDVAVANRHDSCSPAIFSQQGGDVTVLINHGDGSFAAPAHFAPGAVPWDIAAADLDGDGKPDLAVANFGTGSEQTELTDGGITVLINAGRATFAAPKKYAVSGVGPSGIAAGDLNGDGHADLAVANFGYSGIGDADHSRSVNVFMNDGHGAFGAPTRIVALPGPQLIRIGDVDGDADADLVVGSYEGISLIANQGSGAFSPATATSIRAVVEGIALPDLDGDKHLDVAIAAYQRPLAARGNGDGTFSATTALDGPAQTSSIASADLNGDGKPDLVFATADGVSVLINRY